ncbi:MAG: 16S rRNA (uracil(1498)-N(3))-methyltransferase [Desulfobulbaceae bacterium]|uniref:Ribosomal RNA small subunit methyltransferase E n=1 Tax=Candidatus Desulfobia pelagia TaxID=2841692 RepID=A0A8J6NEG0_9BACT|nr:16S rRNA (uracil(1498)-N(3))-methyltransferase [Candidatus Desulfobia pelagia]
MNLILLRPEEINNKRVTLTDHRAEHILTILKSSPGDSLKTGIINGPVGKSTVMDVSGDSVVLEITDEGTVPLPPQTDLILALPRPIMLKRILSQAASLGISRIFLINANRVEKSFFGASMLQDTSCNDYLQHGLEQAVDTLFPEISLHQRFRPFVEDVLPKISEEYPVRLVAHPEAHKKLPEAVELPLRNRVLLAIGPEGGWVDFEMNKFEEQGLQPFSMGPRILKVDTAVTALLAQIDLLRQIGNC